MRVSVLFCRRSLRANHQQKVEEAIEQAKTLRKAMKAGDMATQVRDVQDKLKPIYIYAHQLQCIKLDHLKLE